MRDIISLFRDEEIEALSVHVPFESWNLWLVHIRPPFCMTGQPSCPPPQQTGKGYIFKSLGPQGTVFWKQSEAPGFPSPATTYCLFYMCAWLVPGPLREITQKANPELRVRKGSIIFLFLLPLLKVRSLHFLLVYFARSSLVSCVQILPLVPTISKMQRPYGAPV